MDEGYGFGDRLGQRLQWLGVGDAAVRPVLIMVVLVLAQGVEQMRLAPDQGAVEEFVAAGLDPPFHDRVNARYPDPAEYDADPGIGEDGVEQGWVLSVSVTDQVFHRASRVVEVHDEVPGGLGHPACGRMLRGTEDPDPAGGVFDDGQDVETGAGQGGRLEEVGGDDRVGLGP
jgi:hypothetical protein